MARNGSGTYNLPAGNPVVTGTTISTTWANNTLTDIGTAITGSVAADGQTPITANLPMSGYKLTGLGAGGVAGDSVRYEQFASPPAIGGTAPAAGAFTTLSATGVITSTLATGTAPFTVASTTEVANLKAATATLATTATTATTANALAATAGVKLPTITATVAANALTIDMTAGYIDFRDATLGSGTVTTLLVDPSALVISSGSTLGTVSGKSSRIAVLAINNAGTGELAAVNVTGGVDLSETGLISTTAEGGAGAADSASVAYSTTARTNVAYRVIGYVESTQATAGTWATAPSTIQGMGGYAYRNIPVNSTVRLNTANGWGSTNTRIRRFTTIVENYGSDITYADSAANGGSFTINNPGVYSISYSDSSATAASYFGISLNSTQLTTNFGSITTADKLNTGMVSSVNDTMSCSWTGYLNAGDIVRAHGNNSSIGTAQPLFTITRCL